MFWMYELDARMNRAQMRADDATKAARRGEDRVATLERRIDALVLASVAMWSVLEEKLGVTEAELSARMREIDLKDGKLDGKLAGMVSACPSCGRVMSVRHPRCVYCGAEGLVKSAFGPAM
jgi:hypothetical protein